MGALPPPVTLPPAYAEPAPTTSIESDTPWNKPPVFLGQHTIVEGQK